jgi:DNA primase
MIEWTSVLLESGLQIPTENSQFNISCPFHSDTQPSLSINVDKGVWICHVGCGQGSLEYFLGKYLQLDQEGVDQYLLQRYSNFDVNIFETKEEKEEQLLEVEFPYESGWVPEWIFERGFDKKTLRKWECATDEDSNLVIPVRTKDKIIRGWVTRRLYMTPKYMYSTGLKCSKLLFGDNHVVPSDFICVTEGTLDTMWLDQNGFVSVAIFGASLSKIQEELLLGLPTKELVLCLDGDEAGQIATEKFLTRLNARCIVSNITIPERYKDVQDIRDKEELAEVISNRNLW